MAKRIKSQIKQNLSTFSKADFKKTVFQKSQASLSAVSTIATFPLELRCVKHSPRVGQKESANALESLAFETETWQKTFQAMGVLQQRNLMDFVPFTTLNKSPYHCLSVSRHYKVSHGKMSQVEGGSVKGFSKPKDMKSVFCSCIDCSMLPRMSKPLTLRSIVENVAANKSITISTFIPKSCVLVWWDSRWYNAEKVCEWLQSFGPYLFTASKGQSTLLVCFDNIRTAYRAVNTQTKPGICISWNDVRFYNNGYFRKYEDYTLGKDPTWIKYFTQKKKLVAAATSPSAYSYEKRYSKALRT